MYSLVHFLNARVLIEMVVSQRDRMVIVRGSSHVKPAPPHLAATGARIYREHFLANSYRPMEWDREGASTRSDTVPSGAITGLESFLDQPPAATGEPLHHSVTDAGPINYPLPGSLGLLSDALEAYGLFWCAIRSGSLPMQIAALKNMAPLQLQFGSRQYQWLTTQLLGSLLAAPADVLDTMHKGGLSVALSDSVLNALALDEAHETTINLIVKELMRRHPRSFPEVRNKFSEL
jgi:hypothetical protein